MHCVEGRGPGSAGNGTFSRDEFSFDHQGDAYTCPGGKLLTTRGTLVNDGATLMYRPSTLDCAPSVLKPRCCPNTPARKVHIKHWGPVS